MRIMIVDDHIMIRRGMKMLLANLFDDLAIGVFRDFLIRRIAEDGL